MAKKIIYIITA